MNKPSKLVIRSALKLEVNSLQINCHCHCHSDYLFVYLTFTVSSDSLCGDTVDHYRVE